MHNRLFDGNGSTKGLTVVTQLAPGWVVCAPSPSDPPPDEDLPYALSQGLEQWLRLHPSVRVRSTLPIVKNGSTVGIHVWYDGE